MTITYQENCTVIPVNVFFNGKPNAVYEDGMLTDCNHEDYSSDVVTFNSGLDNEYSRAAEVCNTCDSWNNGEEWV